MSAERVPHIVIVPRRRLSLVGLRDLWPYRDLAGALVRRDITLRYRQTALGVTWVVFQPLLGALVLTFVFARLARLTADGVPYLLFAFTGLVGWSTFSSILNRASASLVLAAPMISKVYFPRILLPISVAGASTIDFGVMLLVEAGLLASFGVRPGFGVLLLPLWFLVIVAMSVGLGLAAAALAAMYRDVQYVVPVLLQLLMFLSPVGYSVGTVPGGVHWAVDINPLSGVLEAFRWSLLGTGSFPVGLVTFSAVSALVLLVLGVLTFSAIDRDLADVI
jgi:lipopolysaccharide transport system permease protein